MWQDIWLHGFIQPIYNLLILAYHPFHDLGFAIIVVTFVIRLILWPLFNRQMRAQKDMAALQEDIKHLREKHKEDAKKLQQETLALYRDRGVSPFDGCLPLILQMPIFIAIYQVFRSYLGVDSFNLIYSFLPHPASISPIAFGFLDLTKVDFYLLPYLAGITQFIFGYMMTLNAKKDQSKVNGDVAPEQKQMEMIQKSTNYFMPFFFVLISFSLPAAIVLYFVASNLFSIGQYYIFNKKKLRIKIKKVNAQK
ncbi:MAG: YidC/Oxa1 family membrane protein insertase [Patescibacteria group bacterium]|nr:YidC/Oxa1 family membrane protein insertase [Patescibacteria group bacterium]